MLKKSLLFGFTLCLWGNSLMAVLVIVDTQDDFEIVDFNPANMIVNSDIYNLVANVNEINTADIATIQFKEIEQRHPPIIGYMGVVENNNNDINPDIKNILYSGNGYLVPLVIP